MAECIDIDKPIYFQAKGRQLTTSFRRIAEKNNMEYEVEPDGQWIEETEPGKHYEIFRCSNCGMRKFVITNYCPHCGRRMVKHERSDSWH